jgi:hypothetical protein
MQLPLSVVGRTHHDIPQERGFLGGVVAHRLSDAEAVASEFIRCVRLAANADDYLLR